MNEIQASIAPAEGERNVIKGYESQYHLATCLASQTCLATFLIGLFSPV